MTPRTVLYRKTTDLGPDPETIEVLDDPLSRALADKNGWVPTDPPVDQTIQQDPVKVCGKPVGCGGR